MSPNCKYPMLQVNQLDCIIIEMEKGRNMKNVVSTEKNVWLQTIKGCLSIMSTPPCLHP